MICLLGFKGTVLPKKPQAWPAKAHGYLKLKIIPSLLNPHQQAPNYGHQGERTRKLPKSQGGQSTAELLPAFQSKPEAPTQAGQSLQFLSAVSGVAMDQWLLYVQNVHFSEWQLLLWLSIIK